MPMTEAELRIITRCAAELHGILRQHELHTSTYMHELREDKAARIAARTEPEPYEETYAIHPPR
jgi:hypothetical protein